MGTFYAVLLRVLFMFPPMILRVLARWEGTTQRTHVELSLMNRVFVIKLIVRTCHVVPDKHLSRVVGWPFSSHTLDLLASFELHLTTGHRLPVE